ncbi:hypothetical protein FQZ97_1211570 [compost metagenome]
MPCEWRRNKGQASSRSKSARASVAEGCVMPTASAARLTVCNSATFTNRCRCRKRARLNRRLRKTEADAGGCMAECLPGWYLNCLCP